MANPMFPAVTIEDPIDIVIGNDVAMETFVAKETVVAVETINDVDSRIAEGDQVDSSVSTINAGSGVEVKVESQNHMAMCHSTCENILERRVKDCIKKRKQRENLNFRKKESNAAKQRMASKRSDPKYRDKERQRDRERKAETRKNSKFREKEKIRDRLYRQRLKQGHTAVMPHVDGDNVTNFCDNSVAVVVELQEAV